MGRSTLQIDVNKIPMGSLSQASAGTIKRNSKFIIRMPGKRSFLCIATYGWCT